MLIKSVQAVFPRPRRFFLKLKNQSVALLHQCFYAFSKAFPEFML